MSNKNVKKIILTLILCCIFALGIGSKYSTSALIDEKYDRHYSISSLQEFDDDGGFGKCSCGTSFKQHKETFEVQYNEAFSQENSKNIMCDCGGVLNEKIGFIGELHYLKPSDCVHNKNGCDYLYQKRTVMTYTCEKCDSYFESDIFDNTSKCKGI